MIQPSTQPRKRMRQSPRATYVHVLALGFASGLAGSALTSEATAAYKRVTATICQPEYTTNTHSHYVSDGDWGLVNHMNAYEYASFICPVPDNTDMPNTSTGKLTEISIQGLDNNGNSGSWTDVIARVCAWTTDGTNPPTTLDCGDWVSSHPVGNPTFSGNFEMSLNLEVLGTSGETPYIWVDMPVAPNSNSRSRIRTIYYEN